MYGGCHKISQVCCGINLKFEQIWRSISLIHLPDFCDATSSPFCYSDAMGHISPICGVPVTSGWWKEERYPRTQSPSHHSVGFLYMLAKEVLGFGESEIIMRKNPMLWNFCCCCEHLSRLDPAVSPHLRESASLGLTMLDRWEDMLGCGNTGKCLVLMMDNLMARLCSWHAMWLQWMRNASRVRMFIMEMICLVMKMPKRMKSWRPASIRISRKSCGNPIVVSMKSTYARSTMAGAPPISWGLSSQGARDMVVRKQV